MQETLLDADGMALTTELECGRGQNIGKIGPGHYRMDIEGDNASYSDYFHVQISGHKRGRPLILDLHRDPKWNGFPLPAGAGLWVKPEGGVWKRHKDVVMYDTQGWFKFPPLPVVELIDPESGKAFDGLRVDLTRWGGRFQLSNSPPMLYSETVAWMKQAARKHGDWCKVRSVGKSNEGRSIYSLSLTDGVDRNKPTLFVCAGNHPVEFSGQWAVRGILEYLLSSDAEARRLRRNWRVVAVPITNPDGNVIGRTCYNARGENLFSGYRDAAKGKAQITEVRALWEYMRSIRPSAYLEFHGWMDKHDGAYTPPIHHFSTEAVAARQIKVLKAMVARTHALDHFGYLNSSNAENGDGNSHIQVTIGFNIPSFMYEPSAALGVEGSKRRGVQVFRAYMAAMK